MHKDKNGMKQSARRSEIVTPGGLDKWPVLFDQRNFSLQQVEFLVTMLVDY